MPSTASARPPKPLRSDAARNRARILAAADEIFAPGGPSIEAVFVDRLHALTGRAEALSTAEDAGAVRRAVTIHDLIGLMIGGAQAWSTSVRAPARRPATSPSSATACTPSKV